MHEAHWGLRESPFRSTLDARFFFESPTHNEALSRLKFLVEHRRRLGLLLGAQGSGKTFLLNMLARDLRRQGAAVAQVNLPGLETRELLWSLATQLGSCVPDEESPLVLWRSLTDRLAELCFEQVAIVLLFDDATDASAETLDNLVRLLNVGPSSEARLTMVLAGDPARVGRVGTRLLDRAELRIELEAWAEADTSAFLAASLSQAGRELPVFDPQAAVRLHELGQGVPRKISQLAELALLAGAGQELAEIDEPTVEAVFHELHVSHTAAQDFAFASE